MFNSLSLLAILQFIRPTYQDSGLIYEDFQEAEELFETISQALLSSVDRDCLSGWGGHVYIV